MSKGAFTVVEVLIVVAISSILIPSTYFALSANTDAAENVVRKTTLSNLKAVSDFFYYSSTRGGGVLEAYGLCDNKEINKVEEEYTADFNCAANEDGYALSIKLVGKGSNNGYGAVGQGKVGEAVTGTKHLGNKVVITDTPVGDISQYASNI